MMYCRNIIAHAFKHAQIFARSNLIITNIYRLNSRKNALIMCLPQIHEIQMNCNKFHEQRKTARTKFVVISGTFLFTLFGFGDDDDDEEKDAVLQLETTIKRSILLIQKKEYKKAEQMLHVALRQAQLLQHYDGITYVYDVMANLAFKLDQFNKAEKLFVSVLQRLMSKGMTEDDLAVVHISLKLANMYSRTGEIKKAENGFQFCLQQLQKHMAKDNENPDVLQLVGLASEWYGSLLLSESRYIDALKYLTEAYNIAIKILGEEDEQTVILLNDLGTVKCMMKEYDQAIEYITEAIKIGAELPDMIDIGSIYVNLGNVYLEKGLYKEAKKNCTEGKRLGKSQNHDKSVDVAEKCLERIKEIMSQQKSKNNN
ncbi:tetratricopeptide repeat domain 19 [Nomia melanderi]|uniref:tetratricopeptide repeat domain 19 n=1 Tax=Nomia melanderi TaxID=2448451 RepID=UPI0013040738|nr:tetratricopeptide repeat protein 19 homolog, mitochondrial [Nomia melanderi]